jgi:hypothetical protein
MTSTAGKKEVALVQRVIESLVQADEGLVR